MLTMSNECFSFLKALMNASIDSLSVFRSQVANMGQSGQLLAPYSLRLLPLFILALLKHVSIFLSLPLAGLVGRSWKVVESWNTFSRSEKMNSFKKWLEVMA